MEPSIDVPDPFTERLLQARLADFWRRNGPLQGAEYDMMVAEERYNKFCREYLSQLPAIFALVDPDKTCDKRLAKLPLQRQLLHIAIYDSLCWNFRPLLVSRSLDLEQNSSPVEGLPLPTYKRVLLGSQEKALAVAALNTIDGAAQLHSLLGSCHTRFAGLVFSTFEAAVLLVYLCMNPVFPRDSHHHLPPPGAINSRTDPLQADICNVTRHGCVQAVQEALKRLRMLAEVSSMADAGARTLTQLLNKASDMTTNMESRMDDGALNENQDSGNTTTTSSQVIATSAAGEAASSLSYDLPDLHSMNDLISASTTSAMSDMASWPSFDSSNMNSQDDFVAINPAQHLQTNWATPTMDFSH